MKTSVRDILYENQQSHLLNSLHNDDLISDEKADFPPTYGPQEICILLHKQFVESHMIDAEALPHFQTVYDIELIQSLLDSDPYFPINDTSVMLENILSMFSGHDPYDKCMANILSKLILHEFNNPSFFEVLFPFCQKNKHDNNIASVYRALINTYCDIPEIQEFFEQFLEDLFFFPYPDLLNSFTCIHYKLRDNLPIKYRNKIFQLISNPKNKMIWQDPQMINLFHMLKPNQQEFNEIIPILIELLQSQEPCYIASTLHLISLCMNDNDSKEIPTEIFIYVLQILDDGSWNAKRSTFMFLNYCSINGNLSLLTFLIENGMIESIIPNFAAEDIDDGSDSYYILSTLAHLIEKCPNDVISHFDDSFIQELQSSINSQNPQIAEFVQFILSTLESS